MSDHTSKNFDLELENLRTRVLQMGGLAEEQVRKAMEGLNTGDHPPVSYTHLRAHETVLDLVCRLLLEKNKLIESNYIHDVL